MNIEKRLITDLTPAEYNPRKRLTPADAEYIKIQRSLQEFGYVDPIIINADNTIIGGHQRVSVMKELGYKEIDVVVVNLDKAQEKALNIALNKISGEWDFEKLETLLAELQMEMDTTVTGFDDEEIKEMLQKIKPLDAEEDGFDTEEALDEIDEPISQPGDIYQLGRHRLMCGDSTNAEAIERLMAGEIADISFTSPPYGAAAASKLREHYIAGKETIKSFYNEHDDNIDEWLSLIESSLENMMMFSKSQFVNIQMLADNKKDLITAIYNHINNMVDIIVWNKSTAPPQMKKNILNNKYEFILIFDAESNSRSIRFGDFHGSISNVIECAKEKNTFAEIHKAVFPISLVNEVIKINSRCQSVLDLFGGTGTTMIACEQLNRTCYMMELDPRYCDVIINRWEQFTGQKAVKIA